MGIGEIKNNTVTHKQGILNQSEVFLYGREIDDFKNVDYNSLLGLNMSCTKELFSIIQKQNDRIAALEKQMEHYKKYNFVAGQI